MRGKKQHFFGICVITVTGARGEDIKASDIHITIPGFRQHAINLWPQKFIFLYHACKLLAVILSFFCGEAPIITLCIIDPEGQ